MPKPREAEQATLDVTAADADRRLDQMSVITLTVHAWELTGCRWGSGSEAARRPERYLMTSPFRQKEVGLAVLSCSGQTNRTNTAFDSGRAER